MKVLHVLRSEPDEITRGLIDGMSRGGGGKEVALYEGRVDYDRLVQDIFQSDKVICWWASASTAAVSKR
ncbi:MAG TPA: hypothetical protein VIV57_17300 [Anaeromyxobacter sp.]